jgi:hypothetical protein
MHTHFRRPQRHKKLELGRKLTLRLLSGKHQCDYCRKGGVISARHSQSPFGLSFETAITTPTLIPFLNLNVRLWIIGAHMDAGIPGKRNTNVKTLRQVLDVLEWGRKAWKDVPSVDRGVIFNDTFVNGVRSMLLRAMIAVCLCVSSNHLCDLYPCRSHIFPDPILLLRV